MKTSSTDETIKASFHDRKHITETEAYVENDISFTIKTYTYLTDEEKEKLMERLRKVIIEFA